MRIRTETCQQSQFRGQRSDELIAGKIETFQGSQQSNRRGDGSSDLVGRERNHGQPGQETQFRRHNTLQIGIIQLQ